VVSPGGALPELVEEGKTGIITAGFTADDLVAAVLRYYEDPKLTEKCAAEGQKQAKRRFDIKTWIDDTTQAYTEASK